MKRALVQKSASIGVCIFFSSLVFPHQKGSFLEALIRFRMFFYATNLGAFWPLQFRCRARKFKAPAKI